MFRNSSILVLTLLASLCVALAAKYTPSAASKYCHRKLGTPTVSNNGFSVTVRSDIACKAATPNYQRAGVIVHDFTSSPLPTFRVRAWRKSTDVAKQGFYFGSRFFVDRMYEYNETNGIPGYQVGSDQLIKTYNLVDTAKNAKWSALAQNTVQVSSTVTVLEFTTSYANTDFSATFGVRLVSDDVTDSSNNITKIVMDPVSYKSLFSLNNINYASSDPNVRLALGGALLSRGGIWKKSTNDTSANGEERPDENTVNQRVVGVNSDDNSTTSGFFSFQRKVYGQHVNGNLLVANLIESDFAVDINGTSSLLADENGFILRRIFLSLDQKLQNFAWDPSAGAVETPETSVGGGGFPTNAPVPAAASSNSASPSSRSVSILVVVLCILASVLSLQ